MNILSITVDNRTLPTAMNDSLEHYRSIISQLNTLTTVVNSISEKLDRIAVNIPTPPSEKRVRSLVEDDDGDSMLDDVDDTGSFLFTEIFFYKKLNGISAISEKTLRPTKSLDDYKTLYKLRSKHISALHYSGWKTELYTADRQTVKNGQFAE